jgi:Protein of unknown function (DUF3102)
MPPRLEPVECEAPLKVATGRGDLESLAAEANAAHEQAERAKGQYTRYAKEAGKALLLAKEKVLRGQWTQWIRHNLTCSQRTANYYMELARLPEQESQRVANLSLRQAIKESAKPPRADVPRPKLIDESAVLVRIINELDGADVLRSHIRSLTTASPVGVEDFDEVVPVVRKRLSSQRRGKAA